MPDKIVKLVIEGAPNDKFQIRFADFLRELNLFLQLLNETDRIIQPNGNLSNDYKIIDLSHSSPATVTIEAVPVNPDHDTTEIVISEMFSLLKGIGTGDPLPQKLTTPFLTSVRDMSSIVGSSLTAIRIVGQNDEINMTRVFSERVRHLLRSEEASPGAIRGMLESINIHNGVNVFRIYPDIGPRKLSCHFSSELLKNAITGVGKYVEVRGILKYKTSAKYP